MIELIQEFWQVLAEMSPYLLLGFLVAGLLSAWVPRSFIERHLGGRGLWPTLKASLLGIPLPLCSCGVIPVAASLRRHRASKGATTSFLLSTPQTGVDSIMVTLALLGPLYAIYRPIAALITGVAGGLIVDTVEHNGTAAPQTAAEDVACSDGCGEPPTDGPAWRRILEYGFITLPRDIGKSLLIGLAIAALIGALVPHGFFANVLPGVWGMLAMLIVSIPLYVCATGSVPMAAAFIVAGVSPGAALVFLVAGPATNAASITTLWKVLGRRATLTYLGTVAIGALLGGLLLDKLFTMTGLPVADHSMWMPPAWVNTASAIALLAVLGFAMWPRRPAAALEPKPEERLTVLDVQGMTCGHCVSSVTQTLKSQPGVSAAQADLGAGTATIAGRDYDVNRLIAELNGLGFEASHRR